jgi:polyketide biosynthesis enoyl-CoA hydratase PksH
MVLAPTDPLSPLSLSAIAVHRTGRLVTLRMDRPDAHNAINGAMLHDINAVLDAVERDPAIRCIVLEGHPGTFCTGMDMPALAAGGSYGQDDVEAGVQLYFHTLRRFTLTSKAVIALIDGRVEAGGVGFVAAADYALATGRSTFRLSEALLGLIPSCVMPFLVRRVGLHKAFRMTVTARRMDAADAAATGLVDHVAEAGDDALRRFLLDIERVPEVTVRQTKAYFERLWPITAEMEAAAVAQTCELLSGGDGIAKLREFQRQGIWQAGASGTGGGEAWNR